MKKKTLKKALLIAVFGMPMVIASVPSSSQITNDTALYQDLHELNVKKIKNVNFDSDLNRLSAQEKSYHEALPARVNSPLSRIQKTPYKPSRRH